MKGALWLVPALALLAGCGSKPKPGTAEAEAALGKKPDPQLKEKKGLNGDLKLENVKGPELMPHSMGDQWSYTMEISRSPRGQAPSSAKAELTYKITGVRKDGEKTRFQLATMQKGKRIDEQIWYVDATGYYQTTLGTGNKPFTPPQPVLRFPLKVNEPFTWSGSSPTGTAARNTGKLEGKVIGIQPVDTELGTTTAVFVETASVFDLAKGAKGVVVTDTFFRPGVGIVRYQQTTQSADGRSQITLRLKDYTVSP